MPELPDVEQHRRTVAEHAWGRTVERVEVDDPGLLHGTTAQGLGRSLAGRTVGPPRRHGKWLLVPFGEEGPTLLYHFRMTGELVWATDDAAVDGAVTLHLGDGRLAYRSRRRLGGVSYLRAGQDPKEVTGELGPDATSLDRAQLGGLLAGRRGGLKSALLDQSLVAGLGNELVDEILWRSRLHPRHPAAGLGEGELEALHHHLHDVLRRAIRAGHVPAGEQWLTGQRGANDPRCPRCGAQLETAPVAGRTTVWCPREQSAAPQA
ncbi:MAG: DNA-formamidopyrimidine glycosylase family protein [Nitriliruptoraceae bacterium]